MGFIDFLKLKKRNTFLEEEDILKLKELEKKAYMAEAEKLIEERGKRKANEEYGLKKKVGEFH